MPATFLIDECLSQSLVAVAKGRGLAADHVVWLGKGGTQDWNLVPFALDHDYIFVTKNRRDFLRIYADVDVHNGLVVIIPNVARDGQIALFNQVIDHVTDLPDIINMVVEARNLGDILLRPWCKDQHDTKQLL